jgi:1-aminocyclopropane-1-carboxylate deaminase
MVIVVGRPRYLKLADFFSTAASPLQPLHLPWLSSFKQLYIKRDDLLHPIVSGNKWRKLRFAFSDHTRSVASMGGPYSNHLHALAYFAHQMGWSSYALVRGETRLTPTLRDCQQWGMRLQFVDRQTFRELREKADNWRHFIIDPHVQWLAEGGKGVVALRGVAELVSELPFVPDVVIAACGTGTTIAGIASALPENSLTIGVAALKNGEFLRNDVATLLTEYPHHARFNIVCDLHLGGYARQSVELAQFIDTMAKNFSLPLEPIYTAKVFYALPELARRGLITPAQRIVVVHTGGLQGARGIT